MAAPTKVQLINGHFQDAEGNVLALGSLKMTLIQDEQLSSSTGQVCGGITLKILLDANGSVQGTSGDGFPAQSVWPTDQMNPLGASYVVTAYSAAGELAWGPNYNLLVPSGATFDVDNWVPNNSFVAAASGSGGTVLEVNGTPNIVQGLLNLESADSSVTITDLGNGTVNLEVAGSSITLKTNGVLNGSQTLLNLLNGSGISVVADGIGNVTISDIGGGAPAPNTPFSTPPIALSQTTNVTGQNGNNVVNLYFLNLPYEITFSNLSWFSSSGDNGTDLSDLGIYSVASMSATTATLVANIGPTTGIGGSSVNTKPVLQAPVTLNPGLYLFATLSNHGAGFSISFAIPGELGYAWRTTASGSAGTLPGTMAVGPQGLVWYGSQGQVSFTCGFPAIALS
jgi:hypothetical protein